VEPAASVDVNNVSIDFRLLVGRVVERPIMAQLAAMGTERYCGRIDLGRQYYSPSNYYVSVRYRDVTGKKKSTGLYLSVR
jgi:hypothetical protein